MTSQALHTLPAIQLDLGDERLRRGGRTIRVRPKTFALLRAFVAQPGRLLTAVTRERMLREMAETIEAATAERVMVLVLEDLHWTDHSTLDLIVSLARRREPARFLLIGVYRPPDALRGGHRVHAVQQELQVHGQCAELPLSSLTEDAIAEYLGGRCPRVPRLRDLAGIVHRRTEGNPLFMVNMIRLCRRSERHWPSRRGCPTRSASPMR